MSTNHDSGEGLPPYVHGEQGESVLVTIREGMEQGAVGLATGMSYFPNAWSDTDELVELCKVVKEHDGVYVTHLRDMNPERGFGGGGVPEALEIGSERPRRCSYPGLQAAYPICQRDARQGGAWCWCCDYG